MAEEILYIACQNMQEYERRLHAKDTEIIATTEKMNMVSRQMEAMQVQLQQLKDELAAQQEAAAASASQASAAQNEEMQVCWHVCMHAHLRVYTVCAMCRCGTYACKLAGLQHLLLLEGWRKGRGLDCKATGTTAPSQVWSKGRLNC